RQLHAQLAECFTNNAAQHDSELATALLEYLAEHESRIEHLVDEFEQQADSKAMHTYIYDHMAHTPLKTQRAFDVPYAELSFDEICKEVIDYHEQVMNLYRSLISRTEIREGKELLESLLEMEKHEAMRLVRQTARMNEL
ncbi:MAG: ATPase, partial [Natronospirillum sp.]